jgi:K+-transporting ATPase ATPase C chain
MRRDLKASVLAAVALTLIFGLAYPLAMTGAAQLLFPGKSDGSIVQRAGQPVGSRLIGQEFKGERYFHSRPSATEYSGNVTFFNNLGPNSAELAQQLKQGVNAYLERERPFSPGLAAADVPVDAVTTSASGVDPNISKANALIQARRVAEVRRIPLPSVLELVDEHTSGRFAGLLGEPGVNVLELNLALDEDAG